ncbi:hypothetical protein CYMTET_10704 [Cymbomonas tetramitiformis]|uniref:Uncharacterized protein n=1 Tax=Cymbomonas tetramitiformis TaxID=36881 RepID=A0AAE0LE76_9CHLO|nr:hypothetical protein CYMTET_10704 [Cymbomonas tetramitiformis]
MNFTRDVDYTIINENKTECILMTTRCFKKFCMKSNTPQSDPVADYYMDLEDKHLEGDLQQVGDAIKNYDETNNVDTEVLLKTNEKDAFGAPTWVSLWRQARTKQMDAGKSMIGMLKEKGVTDPRAYQEVEILHNQFVLGFEGCKNNISVAAGAEAMTDSQVNLRKMFTERFCELLEPMTNPTADDVRGIGKEVYAIVMHFATEMNMRTYTPAKDEIESHIRKKQKR